MEVGNSLEESMQPPGVSFREAIPILSIVPWPKDILQPVRLAQCGRLSDYATSWLALPIQVRCQVTILLPSRAGRTHAKTCCA